MISSFGNPEPTCTPSSMEDVARTDKTLALRRLAEMLEEDAAARERHEAGAVRELSKLTTRLRESHAETSPHTAPAPSPHNNHPASPWFRPTTILR